MAAAPLQVGSFSTQSAKSGPSRCHYCAADNARHVGIRLHGSLVRTCSRPAILRTASSVRRRVDVIHPCDLDRNSNMLTSEYRLPALNLAYDNVIRSVRQVGDKVIIERLLRRVQK